MATTTAPAREQTERTTTQPGFTNTLVSEWTKLRSVRSTWYTLALALVLSIGLTALISWASAWSFDQWSQADAAGFDAVVNSLAGSMFGVILFAVLGVNAVAAEYSSGMIRQTFITTPKRARVFISKLVALTVATLIVGTIATFGMFFVSQAIFGAYDVPTASLGEGDAFQLLVLVSLMTPVVTIVGAALAIFLRSAAGAITATLGLLFIPSIFGGFLPTWWQENVLAYLIWPVADSVFFGDRMDSPMYLDPWAGAVVTAIWMVAFIGGAIAVLNRRDA